VEHLVETLIHLHVRFLRVPQLEMKEDGFWLHVQVSPEELDSLIDGMHAAQRSDREHRGLQRKRRRTAARGSQKNPKGLAAVESEGSRVGQGPVQIDVPRAGEGLRDA
jgi:hypothetical protein